MSLRTPRTLSLFKASDGAAAVDMSVALVSTPFQCLVGDYASIQIATPDGPVGTWTIEDSNDNEPTYNGAWDPFPSDLMSSSASQPAGDGAVVTTLCAFCPCANRRVKWTPSSGGTGILPTSIRAIRGGEL